MKTIEVQVQRDHLERLAVAKSPTNAVAELVWNSLDADATEVFVHLDRNDLDGIQGVRVIDNGHGLPYGDSTSAFGQLGGSQKRHQLRTRGGRIIHGRQGKGRFHVFALGNHVIWTTRYMEDGKTFEYTIEGERSHLQVFRISDPKGKVIKECGTITEVTAIEKPPKVLGLPRARQILNEEFALYLRQYKNIRIVFDGEILNPASVEDHVQDYKIEGVILEDGRSVDAEMTVVEWSIKTERMLLLCDEYGFTHSQIPPGIHAPGFMFTAYLKSALIRELNDDGGLSLDELHPDLQKLLDIARNILRDHFRRRAAEKAGGLVEQWKKEEVYPYRGTPKNPIEEAERQVFDVLALSVHEYLPDFGSSSRENRKLSFGLLKTALETSPDAVNIILQDVLRLPREKQEELAELLERTSLEAIINASKIVANRMDFLQGLEVLVFQSDVKKKTLERRHLHKIIAEHTWLFGEEFNLTVSDASLTSVLKRHLDLATIEILEDGPVIRADGSEGIIDLMLSRVVPQPRADQNEHLIIELKRPIVKIGNTEIGQIKEYATAIIRDERFRETNTRWEFWAVSNTMSESVQLDASQSGKPAGLVWDLEEPRVKLWVKTWGQIIDECRARLRFFQDKLNIAADETSGLKYLRSVHKKYLPDILSEQEV